MNEILKTNAAATDGLSVNCGTRGKTVSAFMDATGGAAAVVEVLASNDNLHFHVIGTITLSGASDAGGYANDESWKYLSARTTAAAVTGTVTAIYNTERA